MGLLHRRLVGLGLDVTVSREPGGTPVGELVRKLLLNPDGPDRKALTETLLYAASRAELVAEVILPALYRGHVVLVERYTDSTLVYQGMAGGIPTRDIENINKIATQGLIPDLTLVFDVVDSRVLHQRLAPKNKDKIELRDEPYHERVREGYRLLHLRCPERIKLVDGGLPETEVADMVFKEVWPALARRQRGVT